MHRKSSVEKQVTQQKGFVQQPEGRATGPAFGIIQEVRS
ncbi:hypothetical protein EDC39_1187 [Geothermobacter ehrlichii]|uniref:Uncharacterized protein n=1 Tax=Geothermobacter ehrlichii TaxID=213224 RepID=A0A5D3WHX8_9BACT|nr:hypothetical protein EDC39_1187 [Geothermobacter ehrlichii]